MDVTRIVEALIFASDAPLGAEEISRADESLDEDTVQESIAVLRKHYQEEGHAFDIVEVSGGYQLLTRPEFAPYLERFETVPRPSRLSGPALEALAIIAYRQPVSRLEVESIRGVSSSGVIRTLADRGLVDVVGRDEGLGRPLLYGTTAQFLEHFGFDSLNELPRPEDLPVILRDPDASVEPSANGDEPAEGEEVETSDPQDAEKGEGASPEALKNGEAPQDGGDDPEPA